jgi:cytochrome c556
MRSKLFATASACILLAACGGWKSGQANSAQGNISQDNRPPATAQTSVVTNNTANEMVMLAVPSVKGAEAARIMHDRHEGMEAAGDAAKAIHQALAGTPDLAVVRANADKIVAMSKAASNWFPAGTGPDVGKTRAKPEIWQTPDDFAAKLRDLQAAASAFDTAAHGTDLAAINARFGELGQACKACHDKYRAEMKH